MSESEAHHHLSLSVYTATVGGSWVLKRVSRQLCYASSLQRAKPVRNEIEIFRRVASARAKVRALAMRRTAQHRVA